MNIALINTRIKEILTGIKKLEIFLSIDLHEFLSNPERISAVKYEVIVVVEAAMAICSHLAARIGSRLPGSYSDCFSVLSEDDLIPGELAGRLTKIAQFRNLIIHRYWKVEGQEPTDSIADRWACRGSHEPLQACLISLSPARDHVTLECIGTPGCSTSPVHCGQWLNSSEGRSSAAGI